MFTGIDLFSDTNSLPTEAMKAFMCQAPLGNEQEAEDPTTLELEAKVAKWLGMESALFFPSSTMANQVAILGQLQPGQELIAAKESHLFFAEAGGPAFHARALARVIDTETGLFEGSQLEAVLRKDKGYHAPLAGLVCVENTSNWGGGVAWPLNTLQSVVRVAKDHGLALHMDGARLINAAVAIDAPVSEVVQGFDTVTVCLSKGLGCPIGAMLGFKKKDFPKYRRLKQVMGGALRQSGILAAAGIYALDHHLDKIKLDELHAKQLAAGFSKHPHIDVEVPQGISTNMLFFKWNHPTITPQEFLRRCKSQGLRFSEMGSQRFRAVTHLGVSGTDIEKAIQIVHQIL